MADTQLRLGEMLVDAGVLTQADLEQALVFQQERQLRLGTILLQEGFVSEGQLVQALSRHLSIPWVNLYHVDIPDSLLKLVPANLAEEFFLIPIYARRESGGEYALYVAMNDPTDESALRFVAASAGMAVKPMLAAPSDIASTIRFYYYGEDEDETGEETPQPGSMPIGPSFIRATQPPAPPTPPPRQARPSSPAPPAPPEVPEVDEETEVITDIEEIIDEDALETIEEPAQKSPDATATKEEDTQEALSQRDVEKHMFGVGRKRTGKGIALTLLDGTTIPFGGATKKKKTDGDVTQEELIAALRAAAAGTPTEDLLPSDRWEPYMAALLEVLMKKHLVFFREFMDELKKKS